MKLLTTANPKAQKSIEFGYLTGILHLAPGRISGHEMCPYRSVGCTNGCLNRAGRGRFNSTQKARIRKAQLFHDDRAEFMRQLQADIEALSRKAWRMGLKPAIRLNGTSDLPWEHICPELFERFSNIQFYDYTKWPRRLRKPLPNYHLTYSYSEDSTDGEIRDWMADSCMAIVFRKSIPETYKGIKTINGLEHDLTFLHKPGQIIGLLAKGPAKNDMTGFIRSDEFYHRIKLTSN